ncbi:ATP-binding SpoIIE family protein phosphatase [Streptacidiphilus jiangxiensis]|uniref:Serine phosphatase RsbU, regulator of sigma subunit n=1 Tax=Streptacidiphilus jiangxiensis TaxID=235985 RepID=A0A1H7K0Q3_STRJI|nr:ATP-binding SpoIIE family protein phosphatase [Streptacidiphilus jiangxiensis]SEK80184.1 Serine phosphatase RsbU, regulator of sigma subunit [Streptacidiphilus jiangxiensis]
MNLTRWSVRLPGGQRRASASSDRDPGPTPSVPASRGDIPEERIAHEHAGHEHLAVHDVLGHLPALVAIGYGPGHRLGYLSRAYTEVFGPRPTGVPAHQVMPELEELGLLPLMDQVYRTGRPRTVKARKILHHPASSAGSTEPRYYTFVCAPIRESEDLGRQLAALTLGETTTAAATSTPTTASPVTARAVGTAGAVGAGGGVGTVGAVGVGGGSAGSVGGAGARTSLGLSSLGLGTFASLRRSTGASDVCGVLVFGAEVTDQVRVTERLRESERRQREAAVTLQRSLLPQKLEQPDDLRVAATYQPGGADTAVGGDWYDVITLGGGRTALVIGDVMGRGMRAAAVMGQLRTAVRAYARLDLPPHEVLQLLDGIAAEIDAMQIATCLYAVFDPSEQSVTYASAGHLPLMVRSADGSVTRPEEPGGPPLGTGGWMHASGTLPFPPGATGVLYTDGLVERRDRDIDRGLDALAKTLSGATGTPDVICSRLLRAMGVTPEHDDDVAALVFQLPQREHDSAELFRSASLDLLGGAEAASSARAFTGGVLSSWRVGEDVRDMGVLAVSELVSNSLTHGHPPMRLRLRRTDRRLTVEVTDADDHLPRRRQALPADESGRGLAIVASIATNWGTRRTPDGGKAVWCEFPLREG